VVDNGHVNLKIAVGDALRALDGERAACAHLERLADRLAQRTLLWLRLGFDRAHEALAQRVVARSAECVRCNRNNFVILQTFVL
jgi:hypothetical protein